MKVAQSYQTLFDPMDYTIHGILPARILEWVAVSFSRGSSQPRDQTGFLHCRWITGKPEKVKVSDLITGEKTATTNHILQLLRSTVRINLLRNCEEGTRKKH